MAITYHDLYLNTRMALTGAGIEAAQLEARELICAAAGKTAEELYRDISLYTTDEIAVQTEALLARRLAGEPIAYLIGEWSFCGLPFYVSPEVLIPRVDTEVLAEAAISWLHGRKMDARVLDLCSGSGCIGCAIADALPQARVVLSDVSPEAMDVSRRNVNRNGLAGRVSFMLADVTKQPPIMTGSFDLVVSNPPYIPTFDILTLEPSVRDYEPVWALDGGDDGLDLYRAILKNWKGVIRQGGMLMFEVGEDQASDVKDLMRMAGLHDAQSILDTRGVERVVTARA